MPYISFDLDAMERVGDVARLIGMSDAEVAWGLLRLWRMCWRTRRDVVTTLELAGVFGADGEKVFRGLETFGFAERTGDGTRIKGTERYLRIAKAQSEAAKRTNTKRWQTEGGAIAPAIGERSLQGRSESDDPAIAPGSLFQRAASSEQQEEEGAKQPAPTSPAPTRFRLEPPPSGRKRKKTPQESFYEWAAERRAKHAGMPDVAWSASRINKCLLFVTRYESALVSAAFDDFLDDKRHATKDPPWPMFIFAQDFGKYLSSALREEGALG